jgi:hypothetical protein
MTGSMIGVPVQVCAFVLGCTVIHAARAHASALTRLLTTVAILTAVLVLLSASLVCAPDDETSLDEITIYNAA